MISVNDLRTGLTIELEGNLFAVVDFQHVKPGKGSAFVRTKLRNVKTGYIIEKTFNAGEKVPRAHIDRREMQYLYQSGSEFIFMDQETFDQHHLDGDALGTATSYLKEAMVISVQIHEGTVIGVEIPNFVELKVVETEPGLKGGRVTAGNKPATLETGVVVQVPLFVEVGDLIQVDTRTGEYLKRA